MKTAVFFAKIAES